MKLYDRVKSMKLPQEKHSLGKKQLVIACIIVSSLLVLYKPILYTYFYHKAESSKDAESQLLNAKKALRFSNIQQGRDLYSVALKNYIQSISMERPYDAYTIISSKGENIQSGDIRNEAFAYVYQGMGFNLKDVNKSLALYNYILAESYSNKVVANDNAYSGLINELIASKLESGEKIIKTISGDIENTGIRQLAVVASNGIKSRFVIFKYEGNDFSQVYSLDLKGYKFKDAYFSEISKDNRVFSIITELNDQSQEINVIAFKKDSYFKLLTSESKDGFLIQDIDMDKYMEIGIKKNEKQNNPQEKILWLKYLNSCLQYYKNTDDKGVDIGNGVNLYLY
jgi:hypothetical protein